MMHLLGDLQPSHYISRYSSRNKENTVFAPGGDVRGYVDYRKSGMVGYTTGLNPLSFGTSCSIQSSNAIAEAKFVKH